MTRLSNLVRAFLMTLLGATGSAQAQLDDDVVAWNRVRSIGTEQAYREFLSRYPHSSYARQAFSLMIREMLAEQYPTYDGRGNPEPSGSIASPY